MSKREVISFGCRLNTYESEVIRRSIESLPGKDVLVFNTCAVTKEAERQARQAIRKARRENPDARIIVTGCAAQINPDHYAKMGEVNLVLGNQEKLEQEHYHKLDSYLQSEEKAIVNDIMSIKETATHLVEGFEGRVRAFVQVQNGCNHRCTFCIIPYGRGNSRSVPVGDIVAQVKTLVASGYKEVVVTGVDITDYGKDLPGTPTLGQMMRRLLAMVPELPRLRLSSIDVAEIDKDLLYLIEHEPRLMPHLHISLQAGDDMVLKRMKRRHSREDVLRFCADVRALRPDAAFGADIIAGFPTEDEAMFENTLNLVKEAGIAHLHVFPYSPREGTPAARMPQVASALRKERAARLREAGKEELYAHLDAKLGRTETVLVEQENMARCGDYAMVRLSEAVAPGEMVNVTFTHREDEYLHGKQVA